MTGYARGERTERDSKDSGEDRTDGDGDSVVEGGPFDLAGVEVRRALDGVVEGAV